MTNKQLLLTIVSAEGEVFSGEIASFSVSGLRGDLGIYPGHSALITPIKPGQVLAKDMDGKELVFYISGGMLEVQPTVATVLADTALRAEDLDEAAAERAEQQANQLLNNQNSDIDYKKATSELAQALAQLRAIQALRQKNHT